MASPLKGYILKHWFSVICLTLIAGFASTAHAGKAIDFNFTDSKGKNIRLSDYSGKWVLVNFWAPWCPRCKMEFPELNDLDARPDFVVVGVAMDYGMDENSVHTTAELYNLRYPQIVGGNRRDPGIPALQVGPVDYYPTSYLYAPDGEVVMFVPGMISKLKILAFTKQYEADNPTLFARAASNGVKNAAMKKAASAPYKKKVTVY